MKLANIIYKIIYQRNINFIFRKINKLLGKFIPNIKLPPSGIIKIKTTSGILKIETNQTSYLTQLLYWKGYKKFEYSVIFEDLVKNKRTFLDIGSNIGYYSLLAGQSNPKIKIYAFEPAIGPKYYLDKNIELNKFENQIKTFDVALSNSIGVIDFYEVENVKYKNLKYNLAGEGNTGTKTKSRNFIKREVSTTTLDKFVKQNNIKNIDIIKLDTEGTEIEILNNGKNTIIENQPIVICETLFNTIEKELEDFFKPLNYLIFNHKNKNLTKVTSIVRENDDGIRNCFFVPKDKTHLISKYT
ncbi:FkbM family methyltransferase [Olleya sp. YS]|uniref:FkbM family methyltransferase n=1 Tax=Olleya sp. YS TaxID=3028318 RepID=UPI00243437AE|nr:FkbM family methyltransferase [Olleya sp. YS]WGD33727.1 FkbM family methyltransferase [Olleya sp. YS]